jgi:transposase
MGYANFPEWVQCQRKTGYEIKMIKDKYYMYKRGSRWDPVKKKSVKKTGEYIGAVTPDGIVPPKRLAADSPVFSLECGAAKFLFSLAGDILESLRVHFDAPVADAVWATAMLKLINAPCPFKRVVLQYETSWMSELLPGLALTPASLTRIIDRVGNDRLTCAAFMRDHRAENPFILIDGSRAESKSGGIARALPGHSKTHGFKPQVNQIYILSQSGNEGVPVFYRNVGGNIPDVTAFEKTLEDAGIGHATVIADTGFASADNFELILKSKLDYIIPLKRNTSEIDLSVVKYEDAFTFHGRAIFAHSEIKDGYRICIFKDESHRVHEINDFVARKEKSNETAAMKKSFDPSKDLLDVSSVTHEKMPEFGVVVMRTTLTGAPTQQIYETYKLRWQIELMFDTLRNTCECDASYMQDDAGFEAWSFINHIMLIAAFRILALIRLKKKGKELSLAAVLDYLSKIRAVRIGGKWKLAEITKKTRKFLASLDISLDELGNLI